VDWLVSYYMVYRLCKKIDGGLPKKIRKKMLVNLTMDFLLRLTPVVGIFAGALARSNTT